jgi:hypothetical protein
VKQLFKIRPLHKKWKVKREKVKRFTGRKLFLFPLLLIAMVSGAQGDTSLRLMRTFRADIVDVAVDNLDNIYILSSTDQLKKFTAKGDSVAAYNQVRKYGKLHSIDVSNPLKLLLYYQDFSTIVVLDRFLSVRTALDLRRHNILQTSAVGLSYDNNIWLFDEYENKLKKIDEEGKVLVETPDFRTIFPANIRPQQIIDQNGTVYVYDRNNGIYLFDYYGTFRKKLPVTAWTHLYIMDKYILGFTANGTLNAYNTATLLTSQKVLPLLQNSAYKYQVANNKLFAWTRDSLHIYANPF